MVVVAAILHVGLACVFVAETAAKSMFGTDDPLIGVITSTAAGMAFLGVAASVTGSLSRAAGDSQKLATIVLSSSGFACGFILALYSVYAMQYDGASPYGNMQLVCSAVHMIASWRAIGAAAVSLHVTSAFLSVVAASVIFMWNRQGGGYTK
jgi:hypothetical protein